MRLYRAVIPVFLLLSVAVQGQPSAFRSQVQKLAVLPGEPNSVAVVDSHFYAFLDRLVLVSGIRSAELVGFVPDTDAAKLSQEVTFLQRCPGDGLYYTSLDRRGRSSLHSVYSDGKKQKSKRVDMDGLNVYQPTFSADGNIMVFAARDRERGRGGFDLWYSRRIKGEWGKPVNLGERINTPGDELAPCISGDYLFFTSTGRDECKGKQNIFVTQLVNDGVVNDTAGMLQFGRGRVQRLPEPFNSAAVDCSDLVVDTQQNAVFWRCGQHLMGYQGSLFAVSVWGYVLGEDGRPLSKVEVSVNDGHRQMCSTTTDATGFYRLILPVGSSYRMLFRLENHFSGRVDLAPVRDRGGLMVGESRRDMVLPSLPVGQAIYHADLFGPNASLDLSSHGIEILESYVRFLTDNPHLGATFMLSSDLTADSEYNALLTAERLKVIAAYLTDRLPASTMLDFDNLCDGQEGCSEATGETHLTVVLR